MKAEEDKDPSKEINAFNAYISEFIGTFCIVFFGGWAYLQNERSNKEFNWTAVALTQGLFTSFCVWGGRRFSGAHFNWAVTITLAGLKKIPAKMGAYYLLSQTLGSIVASGLIDILTPENIDNSTITKVGVPRLQEPYDDTVGFFAEMIATAVYMYMVMAFNFDYRINKGLYGLAAGGASIAAIMSIGPISGGAINPVRIAGPIFISFMTNNKNIFNDLHNYWFYFLGPILGAVIIGFYYEYFIIVDEDDDELDHQYTRELTRAVRA